MIYDIIGDIHGQAGKLIGLLTKLGYSHNGTNFVPPSNHRAIFIGDLIDRGEQEVKTLEIVFAMLDAGVADAVMGNHEYNALTYATLAKSDNKSSSEKVYLRPHEPSKVKQHEAFLAEVPFGSDEHKYWLHRFYELPLWIETEHACFVHACWDSDSMAVLSSCLTEDNKLTEAGLHATAQNDSTEFHALENVIKGLELTLPEGVVMVDKDGVERYTVRVRWWLENLDSLSLQEVAKAPVKGLEQTPPSIMADHINFQLTTDKPIFVGHYWMNGTPKPLSEQVICTDYSAAIDTGYLTCYQFDTDKPMPLLADNFMQFNHHTGQ